MRRYAFFVLLFALVSAAPAAAQQPAVTSPTISTEGRASIKIAPDLAWIAVSAESRAPRTADAQKLNAQAIDAVKASLRKAGAPDDAIKTRNYSVEPQMQYTDGKSKVIGYIARQSLEVRVDDLTRIGDFIDAAGGSGATSIAGIRYDVKDRSGIELRLLGDAVRDGLKRAEAMATGAGRTVLGVWRIDEQRLGDSQPQPMYRMAVDSMASQRTQIAPEDLEIRAQVSMTVILK